MVSFSLHTSPPGTDEDPETRVSSKVAQVTRAPTPAPHPALGSGSPGPALPQGCWDPRSACLRPPAGRGRIQPLCPAAPAGPGAVCFLNGVNQTSGAAEVEPESVKGALCAGGGGRGRAGPGREGCGGAGDGSRHPAHLHARDQAAPGPGQVGRTPPPPAFALLLGP